MPAHPAPGLRWFFALNEESPGFWEYANLVQVAVYSARQHTRLRPVCIYEGAENAFTRWLADAGVPVIHRRTCLHGWVPDLSPVARGAYLRLEIPAVCEERGWDDEYVLYTDCDVMFTGDPEPALRAVQPRFFAIAPEFARDDYAHFNSGVMLIRVRGFGAELPALLETVRRHLPATVHPPYDQAALQMHFADRIDRLPPELNWKPYWGSNPAAPIIHFHGPKPPQKLRVLSKRLPRDLIELGTPAYFELSRRWEEMLFAATAAFPWADEAVEGGVRPVFDGFETHGGFSAPQGPYPESSMPEVRWGLAPESWVGFAVGMGETVRLETVFQSDQPGQALTIACDERELTHVALRRVGDPYTVTLDLVLEPGKHRLRFLYAKGIPWLVPEPREVGVLFRALRVRTIAPSATARASQPGRLQAVER